MSDSIVINYSENLHGRFTGVVTRDIDGVSMASRFPDWLEPNEVLSRLAWLRANDRNRVHK